MGRETGILYQHDPRQVDVLVESLGLENGNTVQTPIVDDVKDENPVWLDPDQISKNRSHVARCLFLGQDRTCRGMSDPSQHSYTKLERLVQYLKGERQWIQVFEFGNMSSEVFSPTQTAGDTETRKSSSTGVALIGRHFFESVHKKTEDRRQKQYKSRTVCSSIGSIRSEKRREHGA